MPFLLQYLLKLSLTLAVLYLFYLLLLKNLTFYTWNRFYLLCYSLISFFIPFINITPWIQTRSIPDSSIAGRISFVNKLPSIAGISAGQSSFSAWQFLSALFVTGAVVMLARLVLQFRSIQSIKRRATLIKTNNIALYDVDDAISPFSFAQAVFINSRLHGEADLQKIIQHEFIHVKQKHTADLLAGELLCIVNWFNPFAWLINKAIRQNLEFIADNSVLQTGTDAREYQYLLLKVTGLPQYSISNNFNISSLKKRIYMMNRLKSARVHLVKFLFVLPLLAVMLVAFRGQQLKKQEALFQNSKLTAYDTVPRPPATKEKQPQFLPPPPPPVPPVPHALPEGVSSISLGMQATVILKNGKKEVYDLEDPAKRAAYEKKYGQLPSPPPPPPPSPDVIVVGKRKEATNESPAPPLPPDVIDIHLDTLIIKSADHVAADTHDLLYVVNGTVLPDNAALRMIDNQWIEHVEALESKEATELYGNKGAHGVLLITTGTNSTKAVTKDEGEKKIMELFNKALLIVNGKEVSKSEVIKMLSHPPKSISMYTSDKADKKYGDKGKDGVIILTLDQ